MRIKRTSLRSFSSFSSSCYRPFSSPRVAALFCFIFSSSVYLLNPSFHLVPVSSTELCFERGVCLPATGDLNTFPSVSLPFLVSVFVPLSREIFVLNSVTEKWNSGALKYRWRVFFMVSGAA